PGLRGRGLVEPPGAPGPVELGGAGSTAPVGRAGGRPGRPDPKAPACYGLLVRSATPEGGWQEQAWLRFVDGRPVSAITTAYLAWCCAKLEAAGKEALLLVWDNAPWHVSRAVRAW